ncbi:hypothetical protein DXG03_003330 [Asterophora parasitica]|uniref:Uncharacterized protein n=1 Tax=Asterophora parasitica TaxID=117018 RepID=A0A9P7K657_9AGAR|nr:hypothetical protein DXG03_003330 [Asterophora parasitica]
MVNVSSDDEEPIFDNLPATGSAAALPCTYPTSLEPLNYANLVDNEIHSNSDQGNLDDILRDTHSHQHHAWVEDAEDKDDGLYGRAAAGDINEEGVDEPDNTDGEIPDWIAYERLFSNAFGEEYKQQAAEIEKLSEYDQAICRAFAYKVQIHTTNEDFAKIPLAFPSDLPLPKLSGICSCVAFLSRFKPNIYDCCINSCCCFVGTNKALTECPHCQEPQYQQSGQAQKHFVYIPLIPHLVTYFSNQKMAQKMQYQAEHEHRPGTTTDVFDGTLY